MEKTKPVARQNRKPKNEYLPAQTRDNVHISDDDIARVYIDKECASTVGGTSCIRCICIDRAIAKISRIVANAITVNCC